MSTDPSEGATGQAPDQLEYPEGWQLPEKADRQVRPAVAALGGALALYGLRRRSVGGTALALAGGWLCYRGLGGREGLTRATDFRASERGAPDDAPAVERAVTIDADEAELRDLWRDPAQLDRIVGRFAEVSTADDGGDAEEAATEEETHLRWELEAPLGRTLTWETVVLEEPDDAIRFESLEGAPIRTDWTIEFEQAPADRGTEVHLRIRMAGPGGRLGRTALEHAAPLPKTLASEVLHRVKALAETGEVPSLEGNPSARGQGDLL